MKNRTALIIAVVFVTGIACGLFAAPSFWEGVGKELAAQRAWNQKIIDTAKVAMAGKKVCLLGNNKFASSAAQTLATLGNGYAPKGKADYLVTAHTKGRVGFVDIDFCAHDGKLLHRVPVSASDIAGHEACMFANSLATGKKL